VATDPINKVPKIIAVDSTAMLGYVIARGTIAQNRTPLTNEDALEHLFGRQGVVLVGGTNLDITFLR
jgi:hypothetical protein